VGLYARLALIVGLALGGVGCPMPEYRFPVQDLNRAPSPRRAKILVGDHTIVRLERDRAIGGGRRIWTTMHVFPDGAILRGGWVKLLLGRDGCEGAADIRPDEERGLLVEWWILERSPACSDLENEPNVRTTLWLGPVCTPEGCDTFRVEDADEAQSI